MANYLVSVFVNGKNVNSYYSDDLDDLITIKALHKGCEISIFDMQAFEHYTREQVEKEISRSGLRWKKSIEKPRCNEIVVKKSTPKKPKKENPKKYWERPVLCIETGQVFSSIRECSEKTGIPYMTISNCIKNGNATRGIHFMNAPRTYL